MQVNWYRNASEKDNNKAHGTGELIEIVSPHGTSESIAIIVNREDGSFVEKPLSLVKQANVEPQASVIELEELAKRPKPINEPAGKSTAAPKK